MLKLVILIIYFAVLIGIGLYCASMQLMLMVSFSVEEALVRGSPHLHTEHLISRLLYSLDMQASLAGNTALPQPGLVSATRLLVHSLHGSYLAEEQEL